MNLAQLQNTVLDALEDIKGQQILVFDAQPLTGMFDRVIIVSGTSNRQTRALAKNLHDKVKQAGGGVYGTEGDETGEWILVDLGDIIVHIMQPTIREYYRLEEIWGKYPIDWEAERELARAKALPKRKPTAKKPIKEKTPAAKKAPLAKASPAKASPTKASPTKASPSKTLLSKAHSARKKTAAKSSATKHPATKKPKK
jgi:ribosome-associated protein